jgi:hypothetical protein
MARTVRAVALVFSLTFAVSSAWAQTEQTGTQKARERSSNVRITNAAGQDYEAIFDDDVLSALVNDGSIPKIRVDGVRRGPHLIRPRTHFVRELLKSVEFI